MIRYIEPIAVDSYWPIVADTIGRALDEELTTEDVYEKLKMKTMALITVSLRGEIVAACVCEQVNYPRIRALRVVALGGHRMKEWLSELSDFLDDWARDSDCDRIEQMGRKGWKRKLTEYDYKPRYVFMTKDLNNG